MKWKPATPGNHSIYVVVDPNNEIEETNEKNNIAWKNLTILFQQPDLFITSENIFFSDQYQVIGDTVTINASIHCNEDLIVNVSFYDSGIYYEKGLVALWNMDEGSGDIAFDDTENSNDGDIKGAEWINGINNIALNFDGDNDWIDLGDVLDNTFTDDIFTITAWVKPEKTSGEFAYQIISKADGTTLNTDDMFDFSFEDDELIFRIKDDFDNTVEVQYYSADFEGHWIFVTGVYDRSKTNLSLYVDAVLEDYTIADVDIVNEPNVRLAIGTSYGEEYPATYKFLMVLSMKLEFTIEH